MKKAVFQLTRVPGQPVGKDELLADLRRVADFFGATTVSKLKYEMHGRYAYSAVSRRFGSWNTALNLAGLTLSNEINISDERLFENLLMLWQHYGRQPRQNELGRPPSTISQGPYKRRFRGWIAALMAFVDYANSTEINPPVLTTDHRPITGRGPSLRLRWKVLQRDRFTCCGCGKSPAVTVGVELHVDHIIPWSKGGQTVLENLQTLCSLCNRGKSNE
jgi:hypothetical protein